MRTQLMLFCSFLLILAACTAEVKFSAESPVQSNLALEKVVMCKDKPSSAKEKSGYCEQPLSSNKPTEQFFYGVVAKNAGCKDKQLLAQCAASIKDGAGTILFETEIMLKNEIDSCLIVPERRKLLCHLSLNPKTVDAGKYFVDFVIKDLITGKVLEARNNEFVVE